MPPPKNANAGFTNGWAAIVGATNVSNVAPIVAVPTPAAAFLKDGLFTKGILKPPMEALLLEEPFFFGFAMLDLGLDFLLTFLDFFNINRIDLT
jgi:hypothetical protein